MPDASSTRITFDDRTISSVSLTPGSAATVKESYEGLGRRVEWRAIPNGTALPVDDWGPVLIQVEPGGLQAVTDGNGKLLLCRPPLYWCPACSSRLKSLQTTSYGDKRYISCETCGEFNISRTALAVLAGKPLDPTERAKFAYGIRQLGKSAIRPSIDSDTMRRLLSAPLPSVTTQMNALIAWLRTTSRAVPGAQITIERVSAVAAIVGAVGYHGGARLLNAAEEDGLATVEADAQGRVLVQLTMKGLLYTARKSPDRETTTTAPSPDQERETAGTDNRSRAVILTALPAETSAVLSHLSERTSEVHQGTRFYIAKFGRLEVVVAEIGAGNSAAASACMHALLRYSPKVALFVGVAGGLKDVQIGDVVVATKVYRYESGKVTEDGFHARPDNENAAHVIEQQARYLIQTGTWRARIPTHTLMRQTQLHVGPVAAGEKVVASKQGEVSEFLKRSYGDALAVEMEGYGFLAAAHSHPGCHAGVVRGISDMLTGKSAADAGGSQKIASECAAAVAFEILDALVV